MKRLVFALFYMCLLASPNFAQVRQFYFQGNYVSIDVASTVDSYYEEAANGSWGCIPTVIECGAKEYHYTKAEYLYGMALMQGIDITQNISEGLSWLQIAANKYNPEALSELGYYYLTNNQLALAEQYLLSANQYGGNYAKLNLGMLYHQQGKTSLAETYYKQAIAYGPKGQVQAAQELTNLYVDQNRMTDAIWSLTQGANLGDSWCAGSLGHILYFFGSQINNYPSEKDKKDGLFWLNIAAQSGNQNAINDLNQIK